MKTFTMDLKDSWPTLKANRNYFIWVGVFILLLSLLANPIFGEGTIDFWIGILPLLFFAAIVTILCSGFLSVIRHAYKILLNARDWPRVDLVMKPWFLWWLRCLAVFIVPHVMMSWQLAPLKREFLAIAHSGNYKRVPTGIHLDGREIIKADFDGRLDKVNERRDTVLRRYGYTRLGGWYFSEAGTTLYMTFFLSPQALVAAIMRPPEQKLEPE